MTNSTMEKVNGHYRILITGAAGFVGHHFVEHFLKNTDAEIVVLDKLTYASDGWNRLRDVQAYDDKRVLCLAHDFTLPMPTGIRQEIGDIDYIFHIGAESHVDNSITDPSPFISSNVGGTYQMLEYAKSKFEDPLSSFKCFFYFSTDEVFGPAPDGVEYKEDDRHNPSNPYAASKSAGEMLVMSYRNTYRLPTNKDAKFPAIITRSMNIFGERQHPEKYIPLVVNKVLNGEKVTIHGYPDGKRAGSRFYIHARNVADGYLHLLTLIDRGITNVIGQDFHITGEEEVDNLRLAEMIAKHLGKELDYEIVDFHSARAGHDLRYALSGDKMAEYGWQPTRSFEESLNKTIDWTLENDKWLKI